MMSFQTSHLNDTFSVSDKDPVRFLHEQWNDSPTRTLSRAGLVALSVFLGLIMTSGFLNNVVVLALFCKFKTLRTPVNVILVNISLSDLLVCACGTTLSFASSVRGRWFLGKQACMWHGFVNSCFGIVSLISLVILSYERYRTLTVYNQKSLGYRKPLLAVGGSWLYSLIWTVPPLLGWSSYGLEGAGTSCSVSWTERSPKSSAYIVCLFIFCLGLPVTVMVYSYGRLFYAVKQTWTPDKILQTICSAVSVCYFTIVTDGKTGDFGIPLFLHQSNICSLKPLYRERPFNLLPLPCFSPTQVGKVRRSASRKREFRLLSMVIVMVTCYLLCWTPYGIVALIVTFGRRGAISPLASVVPSLLAKSSTVINPVIYILLNKQFYKCFLILFRCELSSAANSLSSAPSKSTFIHLDRHPDADASPGALRPSACPQEPGCATPPSEGADILPQLSCPAHG